MRVATYCLLPTALLLLSACGQKGPLYLPQNADPAAPQAAFLIEPAEATKPAAASGKDTEARDNKPDEAAETSPQ